MKKIENVKVHECFLGDLLLHDQTNSFGNYATILHLKTLSYPPLQEVHRESERAPTLQTAPKASQDFMINF